MAIQVKHKFVSAKVDTLDNSKVQPSNWNDTHDILLAGGVVVGRAAGAGQAAATEIPMGAMGQTLIGVADAAAARTAIAAAAATDALNAANLATVGHAAASKATPVDADEISLYDSAAAFALKKLTWANLKATLKTYFDTLYATVAHTHTFASLTAKPTTIAGYGITDGYGGADGLLEDRKASGTNGGTSSTGVWVVRDLNTEVYDPLGLLSIAANQFTVSANGWVQFSAPAWDSSSHQVRLYCVTDAAVVGWGSTERCGSGSAQQTRSFGSAPVTAGKTYRVEHQFSNADLNTGMGFAAGFGQEVYTRVEYWRR